ncbi:MAG: GTPase Era [Gemmatimonadetes bacterium]|nr:GTPase Era [SAR202 cluster bacterium]MBM4193216.1 GTPase Era [Gemmatimonadota bacterium]
MPRCGYVALIGRPNAGKSSLLNRWVGEHVSIVSPKPQTTRARSVGLLTRDDWQIVFCDTPGMLDSSRDALDDAMREATTRAHQDADITVHLFDGTVPGDRPRAAERTNERDTLVAITKCDLLPEATRRLWREAVPSAAHVSAVTAEGLPELLEQVVARLPEGPWVYPADDIGTATMRELAAEYVREAALHVLDDEVPHALACDVEEYREDRTPVYIRATLYVERESQKRIVIGSGGAQIRKIGAAARAAIERIAAQKVFLDLWVKVLPNWRRDAASIRRFGLSHGKPGSR